MPWPACRAPMTKMHGYRHWTRVGMLTDGLRALARFRAGVWSPRSCMSHVAPGRLGLCVAQKSCSRAAGHLARTPCSISRGSATALSQDHAGTINRQMLGRAESGPAATTSCPHFDDLASSPTTERSRLYSGTCLGRCGQPSPQESQPRLQHHFQAPKMPHPGEVLILPAGLLEAGHLAPHSDKLLHPLSRERLRRRGSSSDKAQCSEDISCACQKRVDGGSFPTTARSVRLADCRCRAALPEGQYCFPSLTGL